MIYRVQHTGEFLSVSNATVRDSSISLEARGLLMLILSNKEDWEFSTKSLAKQAGTSKAVIERAVKELKQAGYLETRQIRDEKGRISKTEWAIYEGSVHNPEIQTLENQTLEIEVVEENHSLENQNKENHKKENHKKKREECVNRKKEEDTRTREALKLSEQPQITLDLDELLAQHSYFRGLGSGPGREFPRNTHFNPKRGP